MHAYTGPLFCRLSINQFCVTCDDTRRQVQRKSRNMRTSRILCSHQFSAFTSTSIESVVVRALMKRVNWSDTGWIVSVAWSLLVHAASLNSFQPYTFSAFIPGYNSGCLSILCIFHTSHFRLTLRSTHSPNYPLFGSQTHVTKKALHVTI